MQSCSQHSYQQRVHRQLFHFQPNLNQVIRINQMFLHAWRLQFLNMKFILTSQTTSWLSSWPPSEARYSSSALNERLWIRTLWSLRLCTASSLSKSQMMISAYKRAVQFSLIWRYRKATFSNKISNDLKWKSSEIRLVTYLETHMCLLTTSEVFSRVWNRNDRDVVVVASEEVLLSGNDVSNDDGGAQWEDDVLVVWVKDQTGVYFAYGR